MKNLHAHILKTDRVYEGFFALDEHTIEVTHHNGSIETIKRLMLERGDAVAILAYDPDRDEVLLGNEYRPGMHVAGVQPYQDGLIAGMIEKGESPLDAAPRELKEESGLEIKNLEIIHGGLFVSPGGTTERIILLCAQVDLSHAGGIHGNPDENESVQSVVLKAAEYHARCQNGEIADMKTVLAAHWLAANRQRLREQWRAKAYDPAALKKANDDRARA